MTLHRDSTATFESAGNESIQTLWNESVFVCSEERADAVHEQGTAAHGGGSKFGRLSRTETKF
jgi:hypothetical protein